MNKKRISPRDVLMITFLIVLIVGLVYYMGYYTPLQAELEDISAQAQAAETQFSTASARLSSMNSMQQELDAIHAMPANKITEIAPYDNKEMVLTLLNTILAETQYNLSFSDPSIQPDGTVRRNVGMSFSCESYDDAKEILDTLDRCRWRCLISNLSISSAGDLLEGPISVSATITFFESTNLVRSEDPIDLDFILAKDPEDESNEEPDEKDELRDALVEILDLSENSENVFQANGTTDRAMILTILWRLEGEPEPEGDVPYSDVNPDAWYAKAVTWGTENDVVIGYEQEFYPLKAITNDELNAVLFRYAAYKGVDIETLKDDFLSFVNKTGDLNKP